jgi:hypothetical protein
VNIKYERIEERAITYVEIYIYCESGCSFDDDEYLVEITSIIGKINTENDIDYINEAIAEIDFSKYKKEDHTNLIVILKESGEWEGNYWNKYFIVDRINEA